MRDKDKTKAQLIRELEELRQKVPLKSVTGRVVGLVASSINITERKEVEETLEKNEQEKITILDNLVEHVVYQDSEMKILWANRAACESAQMKREDLLGRSCHEVWADRQSPCEDCPVTRARDTKQPQQAEKMTSDGRWWSIQGNPVLDDNGHVTGTTEITLDITGRKRAEEAVRKAKNELELKVEERTAELVEANEKLRQEIEERKRVEKDLHETKNLLSNTFNALQDLVVVIDKDLRVRMSNWKDHEFISEKDRQDHPYCYEVFMNRKKPCNPCHAIEVFATGEIKQLEGTNPIGGKVRDIRVLPIFDDEGKVVAVIEHLCDITERKQAEQALRENEEKYRQLFENESDAVMIFDAETGQFDDANRATLNLYGYSKEEFLALTVEDISAEKEKTRLAVQKFKDGEFGNNRVPVRYFNKKDGTVFPGEICVGKFISNGRKKIIGAVRDITERKRAEVKLRDSEERNKNLLDSARDIIYTVSLDATIISVNPAIENITGWSISECSGKHLKSFVHPDYWPLALAMGQRALQAEKPPIHEVRILAKSGEYVIAEFSITPLIQKGAVIGILGVGRDITIKKNLEEALNQQTHKLAEHVKELNCLFSISKLLEKPGASLHEILQGIVDLIPAAWQYPEITCAKAVINDQIYTTKNFKDTIWKLTHTINVHGDRVGTLKLCYLEEKPLRDEGPFLIEEKGLFKIVAERLGKIVERKQTQKALIESEFRYHELFNHMSNGVAVYQAVDNGEDFIFVDFNKAGERIDNFQREDLIGKSLLELYPGVKKFDLFDALQRVWRTGKPEYHPVSFYQDGRISGWRENYIYRLPTGEIVTVYEDITDRKQMEQALRESQRRYKSIFKNAPIGFYRTTPDGRILDANPALIQMLGYATYKELAAVNLETHEYHPEYPRRVFQERIERDGEIKGMESFWKRPDNTLVYMRENARAIRDENGNTVCYEGTVEDVTDQRLASEQIQTLSQQLIQAHESERQMISRELHDRVAQDLSTLKIASETLFDNQPAVSSEIRQRVSQFSKILDRTILTVRDLTYDLRPPGLDDMGIIMALSIYCEEFAEKSGVMVDFQAYGVESLTLDVKTEINMYRLVQEGLNNIRKHADASRVIVRLVGSFPNLILRIEDDGKGSDVEKRTRAADSEKRMGLRSMAERVNLLQGQMAIRSRSKKGTKIEIKLPYQENKDD